MRLIQDFGTSWTSINTHNKRDLSGTASFALADYLLIILSLAEITWIPGSIERGHKQLFTVKIQLLALRDF